MEGPDKGLDLVFCCCYECRVQVHIETSIDRYPLVGVDPFEWGAVPCALIKRDGDVPSCWVLCDVDGDVHRLPPAANAATNASWLPGLIRARRSGIDSRVLYSSQSLPT